MANLLEEEYREPFQSWKADPSPQTSAAMLHAVRPVIQTAVRTYGGGLPTLHGRAKSLTLDALQSYDPARGRLRSHLLNHLQRLQRDALYSRQIIKMPEKVALDQMKLHGAQQDFEDQYGRPPSDQELSDHAVMSLSRMRHIRQAGRPLAEGQVSREPDADGGDSFSPATEPLHHDYRPLLQFVYDDLGSRDQFILERLEGLHGHPRHPPGDIARLLKISPAAVSQRISNIQKQIDLLMQLEGRT